jgi:hypothetical protein
VTDTIAERFQRETANHEMTVKHDDGLYRHLRFRDPKYGSYWFDLITIPGALIFQGDGETFAFRRIEDMFEFFRSPVGRINPGYWAEKLTSDRDSVMTYNEDLFKRYVANELTCAEEHYPGVTEAWKAKVTGDFLPDYYTNTEHEARAALDDFEYLPEGTADTGTSAGDTITLPGHGLSDGRRIVFTNTGYSVKVFEGCGYYVVASTANTFKVADRRGGPPLDLSEGCRLSWTGEPFHFTDTYEWLLKDYDWWFLWALHGIVWGIAQYDQHKAAAQPTDVASVAS